jgi:hypothetical protein
MMRNAQTIGAVVRYFCLIGPKTYYIASLAQSGEVVLYSALSRMSKEIEIPMNEKFVKGDRVKHATRTDWGLGEVLADQTEARVQVFFEDVGAKEFDLAKATFTKVSGEEALSGILSLMVSNHLTEKGRTKLPGKKATPTISFPKAIENFLSYFPDGFQDPKYLSGRQSEREYKVAAHDVMCESLGREILASLISSEKFTEVCARAKSIINKTNLIHHYEKIWLNNSLVSEPNQEKFATGLNELLYGEGSPQAQFENFVRMLYEINAAKWTIATYFLFIGMPDDQMFVKPMVTKHAARLLGIDINYRPDVNWLTYGLILRLARTVKANLLKDGRSFLAPRDMIDVQSFIYVIDEGYTIDE